MVKQDMRRPKLHIAAKKQQQELGLQAIEFSFVVSRRTEESSPLRVIAAWT